MVTIIDTDTTKHAPCFMVEEMLKTVFHGNSSISGIVTNTVAVLVRVLVSYPLNDLHCNSSIRYSHYSCRSCSAMSLMST